MKTITLRYNKDGIKEFNKLDISYLLFLLEIRNRHMSCPLSCNCKYVQQSYITDPEDIKKYITNYYIKKEEPKTMSIEEIYQLTQTELNTKLEVWRGRVPCESWIPFNSQSLIKIDCEHSDCVSRHFYPTKYSESLDRMKELIDLAFKREGEHKFNCEILDKNINLIREKELNNFSFTDNPIDLARAFVLTIEEFELLTPEEKKK